MLMMFVVMVILLVLLIISMCYLFNVHYVTWQFFKPPERLSLITCKDGQGRQDELESQLLLENTGELIGESLSV